MFLKTVTDRVHRQNSLAAGLEIHHAQTVDAFVEKMKPYVEEGEDLEASVDCLLRVVKRRLADHQRALVEAEKIHGDTTGSLDSLRRERDRAAQKLHRLYADLRTGTAGVLGRAASNEFLAIRGPTAAPHAPEKLADQVQETLRSMASKEIPPPRIPGLPPLTEAWRRTTLRRLRAAYVRLNELSDKIVVAKTRTDGSREGKDSRMALIDRELSAISKLHEALLVLGMVPTLARKVWEGQRPQGRPRRRTKERTTTRRQLSAKNSRQEASSKEVIGHRESEKTTPKTVVEPGNLKKSSLRSS